MPQEPRSLLGRPDEEKAMEKRFQILLGKDWMDVDKAAEQRSGWLHWETKDPDTGEVDHIGLAPPGKWREKPKKDK
jgi:hypothetical protein